MDMITHGRNLVMIRPYCPCVPHPSLNDQFYKGFSPKITIFINFFLFSSYLFIGSIFFITVSTGDLHFGHFFFRHPQSSYLWSFNIGANVAIMDFMVKMAIMALPTMAMNMTFLWVHRKNGQNVDHQ